MIDAKRKAEIKEETARWKRGAGKGFFHRGRELRGHNSESAELRKESLSWGKVVAGRQEPG